METAKAVVIGSGVVGLAVAATIGKEGVFILEKNSSFGLETSSRNSGVVHAGIYYQEGSLKARLCVEGRKLLYDFCEQNNITYRKIGKIIAAVEEAEIPVLEGLFRRAKRNDVDDAVMVLGRELRMLEPNANGIAGIFSPSTGIVDAYSYMKCLLAMAKSSGAEFVFRCEVIGIEQAGSGFKVYVKEGGHISCIFSRVVINCAGLNAEKIAQLAGIDTEKAGYKTYLLKGDYFSIAPRKWGRVKRLVYPVPKKHGLGIHNCVFFDGREALGPDEYYVDSVDYVTDETKRDAFYSVASKYLPFLEPCDLTPEFSGIRPVRVGPSERSFLAPNDFVIVREDARGMPGLINLIGIESPGLTSSLAIGKYVRELMENI